MATRFLLKSIKASKEVLIDADIFRKILKAAEGHGWMQPATLPPPNWNVKEFGAWDGSYDRGGFGQIVSPGAANRLLDALCKVSNEYNGPPKISIGIRGIHDETAEHWIEQILELCESESGGFSINKANTNET